MARTTRSQVEKAFDYFCEAFGYRKATAYNDVGGLRLDYNGIYGGYNIEEIHNESGGVTMPFGMGRMKASQMYDALWFAIRAGEAKLKKHRK